MTNIPLCVCVCVCIPQVLIHVSINRYLDCIHILAIVNSVAMSILCISLFKLVFFFYSVKHQGVKFMDYIAVLVLIFQEY